MTDYVAAITEISKALPPIADKAIEFLTSVETEIGRSDPAYIITNGNGEEIAGLAKIQQTKATLEDFKEKDLSRMEVSSATARIAPALLTLYEVAAASVTQKASYDPLTRGTTEKARAIANNPSLKQAVEATAGITGYKPEEAGCGRY